VVKYKDMDYFLMLCMWKKFSLITELDSSTSTENCFAVFCVVFKSTTELYTEASCPNLALAVGEVYH
jgi:hypothetical protein